MRTEGQSSTLVRYSNMIYEILSFFMNNTYKSCFTI